MKKIFVLMTLLTTTFVSAQETIQEDVNGVKEENLLTCDCANHEAEQEDKEHTEATDALTTVEAVENEENKENALTSVDAEENKEVTTVKNASILACGSENCTHDKDNK